MIAQVKQQEKAPSDFRFPVHVVGNAEVAEMFRRNGYPVVERNFNMIVFTGGADVHPFLYGQKLNPTTNANVNRDLIDLKAFYALNQYEFPKVGICRGAQFLCIKSGGTLWQNVNGHNTGSHEVISDAYGIKSRMTSTHHQMLIPSPEDWVIAYAKEATFKEGESPDHRYIPKTGDQDEDVEVAFSYNTNSLMFQPHPETDKTTEEFFFQLIRDMYHDEIWMKKRRAEEWRKKHQQKKADES